MATKLVDEVRYDIFRRVLAGLCSLEQNARREHANIAEEAWYFTKEVIVHLEKAGIVATVPDEPEKRQPVADEIERPAEERIKLLEKERDEWKAKAELADKLTEIADARTKEAVQRERDAIKELNEYRDGKPSDFFVGKFRERAITAEQERDGWKSKAEVAEKWEAHFKKRAEVAEAARDEWEAKAATAETAWVRWRERAQKAEDRLVFGEEKQTPQGCDACQEKLRNTEASIEQWMLTAQKQRERAEAAELKLRLVQDTLNLRVELEPDKAR